VHRGTGTQTNVADGTQIDQSLHGEENVLCADTGYTGAEKRAEHAGCEVPGLVEARRSTYKTQGRTANHSRRPRPSLLRPPIWRTPCAEQDPVALHTHGRAEAFGLTPTVE
jgi:hypothetical protein